MQVGAPNANQQKQGTEGAEDQLEKIKKGFKINCLTMGNFETGKVLWKSNECSHYHDSKEEMTAHIPKEILRTSTLR